MFYRTFDANSKDTGWVTVASAAGAAVPLGARLTPLAEGFVAAELSLGSPQLKALALGTLALGAIGARYMGNTPDYGGPIIDPIPPMPPGGPLITPADTQRGPFITSYPAGQYALPGLEGLPMARPAGAGIVGGGYAAGEVDDLPTLLLKKNSEILGNNLVNEGGFARPDDAAAHHIVLSGAKWAQPLRDKLDGLGIGINDWQNGVFLPNVPGSVAPGAYHPSLHSGDYEKQLLRDFQNVGTKDHAIEVLADIREQLLQGTYPGSKPVPPKKGQ